MAGPLLPTIERAMARDLRDYVAAYHRLAPGAGATSSEIAGGVAAFTGLDSPLTTVKGTGPHLSRRDLAEPGLPVEVVAIEAWPAVMRRCFEPRPTWPHSPRMWWSDP
jgi:hypothetical protein